MNHIAGKTTPLFHLGNVAVDMTNLIIGLHLAIGLSVSLASAAGITTLVSLMGFSPTGLLNLKIWTLVTYPFVHGLDLWTIIGLLFFWLFGRQIEGYLGTKQFCFFYLSITAISAFAMTVFSPLIGDYFLVGARSIHFAVFIGFALSFPNTRMWFDIQTKWLIIGVVTLYMIQHIGSRDWGGLAHLSFAITAVFGTLYYWGVNSCRNATNWMLQKTIGKRTRKTNPTPKGNSKSDPNEIDRILDKISRSGFDSLTAKEKQTLNHKSSSDKYRRKR